MKLPNIFLQATRKKQQQPLKSTKITKNLYLAVVGESAEGGDVLDRQVSLRRGGADVALLADAVDLLVEL